MKRRRVPRWRRGVKREIWARCAQDRHVDDITMAVILAAAAARARLGLPA